MAFKSRADQIFHRLPTTRHRCNLDVLALAQLGVGLVGRSWAPLTCDTRKCIKRV